MEIRGFVDLRPEKKQERNARIKRRQLQRRRVKMIRGSATTTAGNTKLATKHTATKPDPRTDLEVGHYKIKSRLDLVDALYAVDAVDAT